MIIALVNSRSTLTRGPLPVDDPRQRRPDITQARAPLGWQPTVALEDGLARTIPYFERLLSEME